MMIQFKETNLALSSFRLSLSAPTFPNSKQHPSPHSTMKLTLLLCALALVAVANAANIRTGTPKKASVASIGSILEATPLSEYDPVAEGKKRIKALNAGAVEKPIDADCKQYSATDSVECQGRLKPTSKADSVECLTGENAGSKMRSCADAKCKWVKAKGPCDAKCKLRYDAKIKRTLRDITEVDVSTCEPDTTIKIKTEGELNAEAAAAKAASAHLAETRTAVANKK